MRIYQLLAIQSEELLVNVDATVELFERDPFVGAMGLFDTSRTKHYQILEHSQATTVGGVADCIGFRLTKSAQHFAHERI